MLNLSVLMGRLTADPELRHTQNDTAVTSFTLAVERSYRSGEDRQADFIDIVAWRNTAEFVCKYFRKGQMMIVQGSIQTRTYEDKNGSKRKAVEIVAGNVTFGQAKAAGESGGQRAPSAEYNETDELAPKRPAAMHGSIAPFPEDVPFPPDPSGPLPGSPEWQKARQLNLDDDITNYGYTPEEDLPF